jgi:hypothetical protein
MQPESSTTPASPHRRDPNHFRGTEALDEVGRLTTEVATFAVRRAAPRWPALIGLAGIVAIYLVLSEQDMAGPRWLLPGVVLVLLAAVYLARYFERPGLAHAAGLTLAATITLAVAASAAFLVLALPGQRVAPPDLLRDAALVWVANVLCFALWYWQTDGGGPVQRHRDGHQARERAGFLWPQWTLDTPAAHSWTPHFVDYVFLAFNTSTAFSPTDTLVLSRGAKLLMMGQSIISLVVIAVLAARAINTL